MKKVELQAILDSFELSCNELADVYGVPKQMVIVLLRNLDKACDDVINTDVTNMEESDLKTIVSEMQPICEDMDSFWSSFSGGLKVNCIGCENILTRAGKSALG